MQRFGKLTNICAVAVLALGLAACGGGGDSDTAMVQPPPPPPPTPYEMAVDNIAAADTAAAAQAAYDAVKDDVTATQGAALQDAVDMRVAALATMARAAMQRAALMTAAGMIDTDDLSTQDLVDAARTAIAGLRQAIADAVDVDDTSMYQSMLDDAVDAVDMAQGGIDTATRRMNQMTALSDASDTLQAALAALSGSTPTQAQLDAANNALTALNAAITGGADLTDDEKAPYQREANNAAAPIQTAENAKEDADDEAERTANAAMAVTARKLYTGINAPAGNANSPAANDFAAAYNDAGTPADSTIDTHILVTVGTDAAAGTVYALSEDKKTTVAANHGWTGKRYHRTSPAADGTYEAIVYSNVEAPKMGRKFGSAAAVTPTGAFEYQLTDGALPSASFSATNVAFTGVTRTAGTETFKLPDPNPSGADIILIPGSYHGVSGTYSCTPADAAAGCSAAVAAKGFTVSTGDTWTFKPSDANARVRDAADTAYASYGWWLHKTENDKTYTASAFVDEKGTVTAASGLTALQGTATYVGGAAGKYALSSSTGGTNDAGHFTARATLEANFTTNTAETAISGTIDQFIGADGESRDWSVKLNGSQIGDTGEIGNASASTDVDTVWTIGDTAAAKSGNWTGSLTDQPATGDGVPKVATGTFYTEHGRDGRMVGAFGANKQ